MSPSHSTRSFELLDARLAQLRELNAEVERHYREGRDLQALNVAERANALARNHFREVARDRP